MPRHNFSKISRKWRHPLRRHPDGQRNGQALVEYVLILSLVAVALIAVLTITGPAVGNVFSNQVFNLLGGTIEPRDTLSADDFWTQVAAVASYTPESPGLLTNTPAPATSTPTVGPSMTPSPVTPSPVPTDTPTPGPSPTPLPQNFGYPFEDHGEEDSWWQHDFDGLTGTWDAEYWDYDDFGWQEDMTAVKATTAQWTTTYDKLDLYFDDGESPGGGIDEDFYARYTTTVTLEAKPYTFKIMKNNGIRVFVNGVAVVDENKPNPGDLKTWAEWNDDPIQENWFERTFNATAGEAFIEVEFVEVSGRAHVHVFLTDTGLVDEGECSWAISDEAYRSAPSAWSDSPGKNYEPRSYCILSLRGYIDLRGSVNPKLEFWDRYNLRWGTYAYVGVSVAGTGDWTDVEVHYYETNLGWTRQAFDLTNFDGAGRDFSNDLIEVRFILDATNDSGSYDGWWIDDISVTEDIKRQYTVGFYDDMEGESHWYPGGTWALSNEAVHSGEQAWSDSPGNDYENGSNSILELDGEIVLDNDQLDGNPVVDPEVVFWHRYNLTWNDVIYIEVSTDERNSWINLTGDYDVRDDGLAYIETNWSWTQVAISLADYMGQNIYLRFRIDARSSSHVADGWWIDDFQLRNRPDSSLQLDWCDDMEGGGANWTADGTWSLVSGPDYNPEQSIEHTVMPHAGTMYWSDSPQANYQHNTNSSLTLKSKIDLTSATTPYLVFWHMWDLLDSDDLYVEVSLDGGDSWELTPLWHYDYGHKPPGYGDSLIDKEGYKHNFSWTREPVSLEAYVGQMIMVRFRLDAQSGTSTDDGWWLDDVCFVELNETTRVLPFSDNAEAGPNNWHLGGEWTTGTKNRHAGARSFTDSFDKAYEHQSNGILELKGVVDLHGTVEPTLYFWEVFNLQYEDFALVEVRETDADGRPLGDWEELRRLRNTTTMSWDRRQVDLTSYIDKYVRIRFRVYAEKDSRVADGWLMDDISIVDRDGLEQEHALAFWEDADDINPFWIYDGSWARIPAFRSIGSGAGLGPGGWLGEYWDDTNHNKEFDDGSPDCTVPGMTQIDFNWAYNAPGSDLDTPSECMVVGSDDFLVRWTRTISVSNDMKLLVQTQSDDGIRVFLDGVPMLDHDATWVDRGFPSTPDSGPTFDVLPGDHDLVVEYYENGGKAQVRVNFGVEGHIFTDSPGGNYFHQDDMSLHLEGTIDLTGTSNPAISYWDMRDIHWSDRILVEISTDEGFTWDYVRRTNGRDMTWKKRLHDLSAYAGEKINIRFRLDARSNSGVDDGWYIDDIVVAE